MKRIGKGLLTFLLVVVTFCTTVPIAQIAANTPQKNDTVWNYMLEHKDYPYTFTKNASPPFNTWTTERHFWDFQMINTETAKPSLNQFTDRCYCVEYGRKLNNGKMTNVSMPDTWPETTKTLC